jgi:hypothetical protein
MPKRRIPYVILVVALLSLLIYGSREKMDTESLRNRKYWIAKGRNSNTYPIVFGGDSRVFRGLSPKHFSSEFNGIAAYNYAYWSNGYGKDYLEGLEAKVDSGADTRIIILGLSPHSLTRKAARSYHYLEVIKSSGENGLIWTGINRINEVFTPFKALDLTAKIIGQAKPPNTRITYHSDGWVETYWIVPDTSHATDFYKDIFKDNPVDEEVIEGLLDFVGRWTRMGIHVVAFRPPTSYTLVQYEKEDGSFMEETFIKEFTAAGGIWIPMDIDAYQTYDGSHLDHHSAIRLSEDLARRIRELLP